MIDSNLPPSFEAETAAKEGPPAQPSLDSTDSKQEDMVFTIPLDPSPRKPMAGQKRLRTFETSLDEGRTRPAQPALPPHVDVMTPEGVSQRIPMAKFQGQVFAQARIFNRQLEFSRKANRAHFKKQELKRKMDRPPVPIQGLNGFINPGYLPGPVFNNFMNSLRAKALKKGARKEEAGDTKTSTPEPKKQLQ